MIQGRKIFNELLISLKQAIDQEPELIDKYHLEDIDLGNIAFDEISQNDLIELIRSLITIYQDKKGEIKTRDINKLFS